MYYHDEAMQCSDTSRYSTDSWKTLRIYQLPRSKHRIHMAAQRTIVESRRKPQITYKSPSVGELPSLRLPTDDAVALPSTCAKHNGDELITPHPPLSHYSKNPLELPLPLYHPFGHLALSLPPLDPSSLGLPVLPRSGDTIRQSANYARRPAPKLRDLGYEEDSNIDRISTAVIAITVRDKPSLRKRRTTGSKRRRREMDDGDATYPAKRARLPRISAEDHVDDEMRVDIVTQGLEAQHGEGGPLRSRGQARQRASDSSESVSPSPGVAPSEEMQKLHRDGLENVKHTPSDEIPHDTATKKNEDKEEGELSEEA